MTTESEIHALPHGTRNVVIACFGEEVAPCFESAHRFRFWKVALEQVEDYCELAISEVGPLPRLRLLKRVGAAALICNGISEHSRQVLEAECCQVISGVVGKVVDALFGMLSGKLPQPLVDSNPRPEQIQLHTADLVAWTTELFKVLGWEVRQVQQETLCPVDLLALRNCPLCQLPVRVAICCGAHAYRVQDEIQELKRVTAGYSARVYVHYAIPDLEESCRNFEIELIDPSELQAAEPAENNLWVLPPLKGPISGHEQLNAAGKKR